MHSIDSLEERIAYDKVIKENTEEALKQYLSQYPNSKYNDEIEDIIVKEQEQNALSSEELTLSLYKQYPHSATAQKLYKEWMVNHWQSISTSNTEEVLQQYLSQYPDNPYEVDTRIKEIEYHNALVSSENAKEYLNTHNQNDSYYTSVEKYYEFSTRPEFQELNKIPESLRNRIVKSSIQAGPFFPLITYDDKTFAQLFLDKRSVYNVNAKVEINETSITLQSSVKNDTEDLILTNVFEIDNEDNTLLWSSIVVKSNGKQESANYRNSPVWYVYDQLYNLVPDSLIK